METIGRRGVKPLLFSNGRSAPKKKIEDLKRKGPDFSGPSPLLVKMEFRLLLRKEDNPTQDLQFVFLNL
jgi:hypothetical protein